MSSICSKCRPRIGVKSAVDITRSKSFNLSPVLHHSYVLITPFYVTLNTQFPKCPARVAIPDVLIFELESLLPYLHVIAVSCPIPAFSRHSIYDLNYSEET